MPAETSTRGSREAGRTSPARERLVRTASRLFYAEGIRSVGVDRLIAEAGVTKATFYRYFAAKDELVLAYLAEYDATVRAAADAAVSGLSSPSDVFGALFAGVEDELCAAGFRGCPFINAAAEFPDPEHPIAKLIGDHRTWFRHLLIGLLERFGQAEPERTADVLVLLRDGAMVGGYLDSPGIAQAALRHAVGLITGDPRRQGTVSTEGTEVAGARPPSPL